MNKILVVAKREYSAAVKTKAFVISLILMPLMMFGGILVQKQTQKMQDTETYKVAVIDRTEGGTLAAALVEAARKRNEVDRMDKETGKANAPAFNIEVVAPASIDDNAAVDQQRVELSNRTRKKDLLAFIEIGSRVTEPGVSKLLKISSEVARTSGSAASLQEIQGNMFAQIEKLPEETKIRYTTNQPTLSVFKDWLPLALQDQIQKVRLKAAGLTDADVMKAQGANFPPPPLIVTDRGMAHQAADGKVNYDSNNASVITNMLLPIALVMLMFIAVMVGASPLATNIVEEKQLRIAEVLLGGLTPFELMFGKLLGGAATAITLASIYFIGIYFLAYRMDLLQYVRVETIAWFILFTLVGVMMYGSLFVAAGAAVTNLKEAQTTLMPVMLIVAMPFFVLQPIVQYPNSLLAKSAAFFPLTAPSVSIIRAAIPSGAQPWEMVVSAVSAIIGMLVVVWIAGRIFRAGMLLTSKPASMKELFRWIVSG